MKRDAADFGGDLLGVLLAAIEHRDLRALGGHGARGGGTEARAAAGDENGTSFNCMGRTFP